jgi:hypothetical protein
MDGYVHYRHRVVVEHSRYILRGEFVGGVTYEKTSLADGTVTDHHTSANSIVSHCVEILSSTTSRTLLRARLSRESILVHSPPRVSRMPRPARHLAGHRASHNSKQTIRGLGLSRARQRQEDRGVSYFIVATTILIDLPTLLAKRFLLLQARSNPRRAVSISSRTFVLQLRILSSESAGSIARVTGLSSDR